MDLWHVKERGLANLALNRYLDLGDETDGLPLLPLFMALRASIRATVNAAQAKSAEARAYFDLAGALLQNAEPRVIAIGGLSGSGKSSAAARLAPGVGAPPGARLVNSDRLRKQLFRVAPTARLPQEAYASEISARVYDDMLRAARRVAMNNWPVIVDAVFDRPPDRAAIEAIARELGVPFNGFWLDADFEQRALRVDARQNDVSDATREVLLAQERHDPGAMQWTRIDASRGLDSVTKEMLKQL
jgi:predicted kinase